MYSIYTRILINNTNSSDVCKQLKDSRGYRLETIKLTRFAHNVLIVRAYSFERHLSKAWKSLV